MAMRSVLLGAAAVAALAFGGFTTTADTGAPAATLRDAPPPGYTYIGNYFWRADCEKPGRPEPGVEQLRLHRRRTHAVGSGLPALGADAVLDRPAAARL
jgi:hypothetical protein